jgi:HSP20 family protein
MPATITRWTPLRELDLMERRMRRMLEGIGLAPALLPAADVVETPGEFVLELDVPGYEEKELEIEISDHTLTITGERKEVKEEKEKTFRLHERLEGEFVRSFSLPLEADTEHVKAVFGKGVLEVHVPKVETAITHKVEISKLS